MYDSIPSPILLDKKTRNQRTEALSRLYGMGFNLIPVNGKHPPCIEWKPYQTQRVTPEELRAWMRGRFPRKDGSGQWQAELLNFALLTGAIPWDDRNPGVVVIDPDDEDAERVVRERCPETPLKQKTGSGRTHRVYRRPSVDEVPYLPNRQKTVIGGREFHVDIRADGGYIMAPGSIHPRTKSMYLEAAPWTLELLKQCPVYDPNWLPCERATQLVPQIIRKVGAELAAPDHDDLIARIETPHSERERMARRYLESVPGTQQGTGADRRCTGLTMKLLYGFALPAKTVLEMLTEWGEQEDQLDDTGGWYPWTEEELARKIEWCLGQEYRDEIGDRLHPVRKLSEMEIQAEKMVGTFEVDVPRSGPTIIDPKDHLDVAQRFFEDRFTDSGKGTLIHHQSVWHQWTGTRYESRCDDDIKARLWKWLAKCRIRKKDKLVTFRPTRNLVNGVLDALKAVANQPSDLEPPCWLSSGPSEVIAFENGLLDVEQFLDSGATDLLEHTPDWFSPNCLPHGFDPEATCPQWLEFLQQVFDQDEERIEALQQWFGYNLVADNRQHKLALLIGPPRSGKGTTMAVMSAMLGRHNIANLSLASLGGRFGLEPLLGKVAALVDEGHLGKFSDSSSVLERLKAISGGSEQTVDRKGLAALSSVALKVRFTIAVNELPRLSDSSAALRSRLLVLPYLNSYEGQEDFGLVERLLAEIPGVTNWALQGLRDLRANNRFRKPCAGEKILRDFVYLSSPVQAFVDECCLVDANNSVRRKDLQLAWHMWCSDNGHVPGSLADFGRKLRAVFPRIDDERRRVGGRRDRWYLGLGLTSEVQAELARQRYGG